MKDVDSDASTAQKATWGRKKPIDAIALLIQDHRKFEELFNEYASAGTFHKKLHVARRLCDELTLHDKIEESFLYPAARSALGSNDTALTKARVKHASQKWLIAQLRFDTPSSPLFDAKMEVLRDYVLNHAREEEVEIFPRLRENDINSVDLISEWIAARLELEQALPVH